MQAHLGKHGLPHQRIDEVWQRDGYQNAQVYDQRQYHDWRKPEPP